MITETRKDQKPIKCTLTRIMDDFNNSDIYKQQYVNILKNYIYVPDKKIIV